MNGIIKPRCVICLEVLSNELVKENKLKVHLEAYHTPFIGKDQGFFPRKEQEIKQNQKRSKMMRRYNFQEQRITECILDQSEKGEINSWK